MIHSYYSPNNNTRTLSTGDQREINVDFLQQNTLNGTALISGRSILDLAKDSIKNGKKALAFAKQFLQNGSLPSGRNVNDLLNHVKDKMYNEEQQSKDTIKDKTSKKRDDKWVFNGYVAFALFACPILVEQNDRLQVYCEGGEKEGISVSRVGQRKRKSEERSKKRTIEAATYQDRGMNQQERFQKQYVALEEIRNLETEKLHARIPIQTIETRISNLTTQRAQSIELLKLYNTFDDRTLFTQQEIELKKLTGRLADKENELEDAKSELQQKLLAIDLKKEGLTRCTTSQNTPAVVNITTPTTSVSELPEPNNDVVDVSNN